MHTFQEIEEVKLKNKAGFNYAGLRVTMTARRDGTESWNDLPVNVVEISWKDKLLISDTSLPEAIVKAFAAVRVCRPGITDLIGDARGDVLIALSALGSLVGIYDNVFCDTAEVETLVYPDSDEVRKAIPDWDDRPRAIVYAAMSSIDRHNFDNEAVQYRIVLRNYATTFEHRVNVSVHNLPDITELVNVLTVKHFA